MPHARIQAAPRRPILLLWGILIFLAVICAYVLALALVAFCIALSIAGITSMSLIGIVLGAWAAVGAGAILWSLVPRRDQFPLPGPLLDASAHPRLFAEITAIATEFKEPLPAKVYLMLEPNAWVAQRGGYLGFGSQRVMALGLPVLSVLTISEFRAIVAHEFAHYYGGDTGTGPWIQKARDALSRSLEKLTSDFGILDFLSRWAYVALLRFVVIGIFVLYWKLFLRLTILVSRQAEYRADELACAVAGATPLMEGLRKVETSSFSWPWFWRSEAIPSLAAGFRAPLAAGFASFLQAPHVSKTVPAHAAPLLEAEKPAAFATHPTFKQRFARAASYRFAGVPLDDSPAIALLDDAPRLESAMLQTVFPDADIAGLQPVQWELVGRTVYLPSWTTFVTQYRDLLAPYSVTNLPDALANLMAIGARIRDPQGSLLTREQRAARALDLLWMALALVLVNQGWELHMQPGIFCLRRNELEVEPHELVRKLKQGAITPESYRNLIQELGIADLPLIVGCLQSEPRP